MKNAMRIQSIYIAFTVLAILCTLGCTRDDEDLQPATFSKNGEVFIDGFSGGLQYLPFEGSKLNAFTVDTETKYEGSAAMRFDVPNEGDPDGAFAGAIFPDAGARDLSGFNALTFWAKATQAGTINEIGFGNDFAENKFLVTKNNLQLSTNWKKYIIQIPDASKLLQEQGMLWYSEGPEEGKGYSFWLDNVQFEKVELSDSKPTILNGEEVTVESFIGADVPIAQLQQTVTLSSEVEQTVTAAPAYFNFASSDASVAIVNDLGKVVVVGPGSATVTATLGGISASGSLVINSIGEFVFAPTPEQDPSDVISIFSNAYENVPVDYYNGFWQFSTTKGGNDLVLNNDNIISYTDLNFVGIQFAEDVPTIDASQMTHLHIDLLITEAIEDSDFLRIGLTDIGADNAFGGGDDSGQELSFSAPTLVSKEWVSLDIPLTDFTGLINRSNLAQVVFVSDNTISAVLIDNIFLYRSEGQMGPTEPDMAAPIPTQSSADVISIFSDTYDDVPVDTWRTDWSVTDFEDVTIAGDPTKKYANLDFVGVETVSNPINVSAMSHLHLDIWSSDYTFFGLKLVDFGPDGVFGGGDDSEHQVNFENPMQGEWVSLDIPMADFVGLTNTSSIGQFIFVGQPTGRTTVFLDNIFFYGEGGLAAQEPEMAAPFPTNDAANVISLFSDAYDDVVVDTWRTDWSASDFEDVVVAGDPTKKYANLDFVGIETVASPIDASELTHLHLDVWSPNYTLLGLKLVDFGPDGVFNGGDDSEHQIDFENPIQGEWVSLDIPLDDFVGLTNTSSIAQFIFVGQPTGATTIFLDNLFFYGDDGGGIPSVPDQAAPMPTRDAANVISLFSETYDDVPVDSWRTDWSVAIFEDLLVQNDSVKKYSEMDFVGIETVTNVVDASEMTHIHLDLWSADLTNFGLKIVDFGADGVFGGDDSEHQINIENPVQGEWVGLDIPLSDFAGLTGQNHLAQYILVAQPTGTSTIYLDNFYFYKE